MRTLAKSKWDEVKEKLILVEGWARDGLTELQIAQNLGISRATLENYKRDHLDFLDALKRNKEIADRHVENALYKRALGYTYKEVKKTINPDGAEFVTETVKEVVADTTAQIFWLKNRKPREWRDKQEVEHTGETTVNSKIDFSSLSTEQIRKMLQDD